MDNQTLASLPPQYLAAILRDPRLAMASKMQEEGSDTSPVQSPWQGLARMVKGGLGAYTAGKAYQGYGQQGAEYNKKLAGLLKSGSLDQMIAAAGNDPELASTGLDLAKEKAKSDYELNRMMGLEMFKNNLDPVNAAIRKRLGGASSAAPPPAAPALPPDVGSTSALPAAPMTGQINASELAPPGDMLPPVPAKPPVIPAEVNTTIQTPPVAMGRSVGPDDPPAAFVPPQIQQAVANTPAGSAMPQASDIVDYAVAKKVGLPDGASVSPDGHVSYQGAADKKAAEKQGENLSDAQKTLDIMHANLGSVMQRFDEMAEAAKLADAGLGVGQQGDGIVPLVHNATGGQASVANALLRQRSAQGILPELGPQLAQAGVRGNKFLETIASNASGLNLNDSKEAKLATIEGLRQQYLSNLHSTAQQVQNMGGNVPSAMQEAISTSVKKYPKQDTLQSPGKPAHDLQSLINEARRRGLAQ